MYQYVELLNEREREGNNEDHRRAAPKGGQPTNTQIQIRVFSQSNTTIDISIHRQISNQQIQH